MARKMRAFGYICPECGKRVYGERTEFALQAAAVALVCDCGRSELKAEPDGSTFRRDHALRRVRRGAPGGGARASVMEGQGVGLACRRHGSCAATSGSPGGWPPPWTTWRRLSKAEGGPERDPSWRRRDHVRGPLGAAGHRRPGRHLLHLRAQGAAPWRSRRGGGPGVPRLRRAARGSAPPPTRTWTGCAASTR